MANDYVRKLPYDRIYKNFIDPKYIPIGENEYYLRDRQTSKPEGGWRHLRADEIESLVNNKNVATNWDDIRVTDSFDTSMVKRNSFFGLVRIGRIQREILEYHDLRIPVGITDSCIVSCDIGDDVAIHNVNYLANYIIQNQCILFNVNEISTTDHSKFGNGIIKDGEDEDVRVWLEVMNEAGGRKILPFDGMITADAYLWAKYADDKKLQNRLFEITQGQFDSHRGYYGIIGESSVIKNSWILKDAKIGPHTYIKGASKLKNITINSSKEEPSQIGEGVILVNGIVGYGCRIFYSAVATRFVIGDKCNLKYGARLINSVLGDNSTISCCEVLNNLIFPAHEQHHNNSFLISACIMGQSNMAAGATLGSNHNSRATDGEIVASRGFWPGLCSSIKHSSRFASFTLLSKGDYNHEMDISLPFSLVNNNISKNNLEIMPAYWWMYNMYAIARNTSKYRKRDTRKRKIQNIEFETLAPDTIEEIIAACKKLEVWTAKAYLRSKNDDNKYDYHELRALGRDLMTKPEIVNKLEILGENIEKSSRKVVILKAYKAYHAYHDMIIIYAMDAITRYMVDNDIDNYYVMSKEYNELRRKVWINLGGQMMTQEDVNQLRDDINKGILNSWEEIHNRYNEIWQRYPNDKIKHACLSLYFVLQTKEITKEMFKYLLLKSVNIQNYVCEEVYQSRKKDYDNKIRNCTFRNEEEKIAVIGNIDDNSFVKQIRKETEEYISRIEKVISMIN